MDEYYECQNCDFKTAVMEDLNQYHDFWSRIEPGDIMPAGDCPECQAHVHIVNKVTMARDAAPDLLEAALVLLDDDEWTGKKMLRQAIKKANKN
jgi:hypothetical protein